MVQSALALRQRRYGPKLHIMGRQEKRYRNTLTFADWKRFFDLYALACREAKQKTNYDTAKNQTSCIQHAQRPKARYEFDRRTRTPDPL